MKIVGIAGAKRAGKDTLAGYVVSCVAAASYPYRTFVVAFADALKRMMLPLGYPADVLWGPSEGRSWVHPVLGISAREMLQKVGTEVARQIDPDFWVKAWGDVVDKLGTGSYTYTPERGLDRLLTPLPGEVFIVAADLRFANEHADLARRNAYTVLVEREAASKDADQHLSERWCREAARQCVREVVLNDGPMEALEERARAIFEALRGS